MYPSFRLQEGALLLGDAHYSHIRPQLLQLIEAIASKKLQIPQLILMGDILDALFGSVTFTLNENREIVELIGKITEDIEVIYLEGNHDFNLKNIFPLAEVFTLKNQPVIAEYLGRRVAFAHGDFDGAFGYRLYSSIIRNPLVLKVLNAIDVKIENKIIKSIDSYLGKKDDCKEFIGFKEYLLLRGLERYGCDYFIEGHYHQNKSYTFKQFTYINLSAFACNQRYFIVKFLQDSLLLEEKSFKGSR